MNAQTFDGFTVPALKAIARDRKLTGYSRMRRAELIELIINDNEAMETEIKAELRKPAVALNDFPAVDGRVVTEAHAALCARKGHASYVKDGRDMGVCPRCGDVTSHEQATEDEITVSPIDTMRMAHSEPIDDVIGFARKAIAALMPTLAATKLAFETLRDDESASPNRIDLAYQVYSDTHQAIEEYKRTIAYAAGEHACENNRREVGMTEACAYGCKIYRCDRCQDEATIHNATYGCKGI